MSRSARFEFRLSPADEQLIKLAAAHAGLPTSEFVRRAVMEEARATLATSNSTVVPPDYFDNLMAELGAMPEPNERTSAAAQRLPSVVTIEVTGCAVDLEMLRSAVRVRRQ